MKYQDKIKEIINIKKIDFAKTLIDKLPNDITLKNFLVLITCIIKDHGKF